MNDKATLAGATPKQASLVEHIDTSLQEIISNSKNVRRRLDDMEEFLFGCDTATVDEKTSEDTPMPNGWRNQVIKNLDTLQYIVNQQEKTLDKISNFYQ